MTNRQTLGYALAAGGVLGSLFAFVFISQQVFTEIYQLGHYFPLAFAGIAIGTAIAGFINSRLVGRLGMRVISHGALLGFVAVAATMLVAAKLQMLPLPLFMALSASMMFAFGLMIGNFTALAMEPQGHIAGTASSLYARSRRCSASAHRRHHRPDYDGTAAAVATGFFLCTLAALAWCWWWKRPAIPPHSAKCDRPARSSPHSDAACALPRRMADCPSGAGVVCEADTIHTDIAFRLEIGRLYRSDIWRGFDTIKPRFTALADRSGRARGVLHWARSSAEHLPNAPSGFRITEQVADIPTALMGEWC